MSLIALATLVLLGSSAAGAEHSLLPTCVSGVRHIELTAALPGNAYEICVRSGMATTVLFDSKLSWVTLMEGYRVDLHWGENGLTIVPSAEVYDGERISLTVHFKDGAAPASVTFILVVHPSQVERQVEVSRKPRTLAAYKQEAIQARADALQCREEHERLRAVRGGGLGSLLSTGGALRRGVLAKEVAWVLAASSRNTLAPYWVTSYRFDTSLKSGDESLVQVAVELGLKNDAPHPWMAAGAALLRNGEEVKRLDVVQATPIALGLTAALVVETTLTEQELQGTFTLKLWDAEGRHVVTIDGVTFP